MSAKVTDIEGRTKPGEVDLDRLARGVRLILEGIGEDPDREGLPRRQRPVKTAALSLSREAGRPNVFEAEWRTWTGSADLTVTKAWEASATLDLSSRKLRISTGESSASCHGVESSCQVSLGSVASKRMKEDFVRL